MQFIWAHGYFNQQELLTVQGEEVKIIFSGEWNSNQGPDFTNARLVIGKTSWAGQVELHIKSSDWRLHNHDGDPNYRNVILHVVWEHDDYYVENIPVLELQGRVPGLLISRYQSWMNNLGHIACEREWINHPFLRNEEWFRQLIRERLNRKSKLFFELLANCGGSWSEVFWRMLARNFGYKINADAFEAVAASLPLKILSRHKHQIHQLESLLLGQAGLLHAKATDAYSRLLQKEYHFLKTKYKLKPISIPVQFLRMRPQNFPTVRLAQLAQLIKESVHLFSIIKEERELGALKSKLKVTANDYWHEHYRLGVTSAFKEKILGVPMIENILINTIVPALYAYGAYHKDDLISGKSLRWLSELGPESNSIIAVYDRLGFSPSSAADTQALHELKKSYCDCKGCLNCDIGNSFLKIPGRNRLPINSRE